jgi:hypothetical protein
MLSLRTQRLGQFTQPAQTPMPSNPTQDLANMVNQQQATYNQAVNKATEMGATGSWAPIIAGAGILGVLGYLIFNQQ